MNPAVVLVLAAGTYALRLAGPLLRRRITISQRWERLLGIAATVLLAAFVATGAAVEAGGFAGVARVGGVVIAGVLAFRGAPFVLVVLVAAAVTAALRLAGVG
ncbi:AzlD domain-containing protein [Saccharopolyspora sp. NFXS83]|uniref:AzlD domain-containing protein n=1 Tax=Saccharopolyspora sp. NFXS83 TaxID=2993560 RepID=UPI00224AE7EA|nr:AzlD domain-containing protein [Saccharopolyspora sp. NFXS83]MCX2730756.1 AzlD domain-containing protein [Saccharopolyspora sp. NFXS83]